MVGRGVYNGSAESVLRKVSQVELAAMYIPSLKEIPSVINSPLRKDEHPSFSVYSPDGIKVKYYDYATGESGGIVDFIMRLFNCSFPEAIGRIENDIAKYRNGTLSIQASSLNGKISVNVEVPNYTIRTQMRDWEDSDFEYWASYGIPKNWVLHADIYPISYIFIISETGYVKTVKADPVAFTFVERKDGKITEKVYQPFNKEGMKWRSGHDSSVWDLWTKLPPEGDKLIITSSRKDALCIWANTGIPSVSLQSETTNIKPQVMEELKGRFKNIFILYDNDFGKEQNHGRIDAKKIVSLFNIQQIEIPDWFKAKDPSDLFKKWGKDTLRQLINFLTRQENEKTDNNL